MVFNIEYSQPVSLYRKMIETASNYFHLGIKEKIIVLNAQNEAIKVKVASGLLASTLKVISYATVILPLLASIPLICLAIEQNWNEDSRFKIQTAPHQDLPEVAKDILYKFNRDKKLWVETLGEKPEALREFPKEVKFLKKTKMLFNISAYGEKHKIQYDLDDHPKIMFNGEFKRVDEIVETFDFKPDQFNLIRDKDNNNWTYTYDLGLTQVPWTFDKEFRSFELNAAEMQQVREAGAEFNPQTYPLKDDSCFIQVVTTDHGVFPETGFFRNASTQLPGHASVRLIKADGSVYSTGLESLYVRSELFKSPAGVFQTIPATISKIDYEELRPFYKKYVTTVPIDAAMLQTLLDEMDQIAKEAEIGFNFVRMNCTSFSQFVLNRAGVEVNTTTLLRSALWKAMPNCSVMSKIGSLFKKSVSWIPGHDSHTVGNWVNKNLFLGLGINKVSSLIQEKPDPTIDPTWSPLWTTHKKDWANLPHEEQIGGYFTPMLVAWQKKQDSTRRFNYEQSSRPQFYIAGGEKLGTNDVCS